MRALPAGSRSETKIKTKRVASGIRQFLDINMPSGEARAVSIPKFEIERLSEIFETLMKTEKTLSPKEQVPNTRMRCDNSANT
jgi:hypothetical protein